MQACMGNLPWPVWLAAWYVLVNLLTVCAFWRDKRRAEKGAWRIPEKSLHSLELLGGWIGAVWAIFKLRHKCAKPSFLFVTFLAAVAHVAAAAWILRAVWK